MLLKMGGLDAVMLNNYITSSKFLYEVIVNEGEAQVNYRFIEIDSE